MRLVVTPNNKKQETRTTTEIRDRKTTNNYNNNNNNNNNYYYYYYYYYYYSLQVLYYYVKMAATLLESLVEHSQPANPRSGKANSKLQGSPKLSPDCVLRYKELQQAASLWDFVILKLSDDESQVGVHFTASKGAHTYEEMLSFFPDQDPCWALVNIRYTTVSGGKRSKAVLISWIPETLRRVSLKESVRVKMQAVFVTGLLKAACKGIQCNVEASNVGEASHEVVLARASRHELDPIAN